MTKISAKIVADSKNEWGNRITTMEVIMPRFILAEFNTHRMFSRNSASSRAIPFEKMLKMVEETPFIPMAWQKDHKGMQGSEYITDDETYMYHDTKGNERSIGMVEKCIKDWHTAKYNAIKTAKLLNDENEVTKQLCNRLLEPFMYHKVLVTATEWENFFALRCPRYTLRRRDGSLDINDPVFRSKKDYSHYVTDGGNMMDIGRTTLDWLKLNEGMAEIHMMELAECMWDAMNESTPKQLKAGDYHIPYEDKIDYLKFYEIMSIKATEGKTTQEVAVMISTVMCARVSYTTIETEQSEWTYEKYINKHQELTTASPLHASPMEHCAMTMGNNRAGFVGGQDQGVRAWSGNLKGFIQYRKTFSNENVVI